MVYGLVGTSLWICRCITATFQLMPTANVYVPSTSLPQAPFMSGPQTSAGGMYNITNSLKKKLANLLIFLL
jgi:hypothetical protein